ncbi:MAG: hypothetical protein ACRD6I_13830, partial [Candidatus Acidiferrales bacterium]
MKSYIVGNRKQRQFVVEACKELEMMPTTERGLDLKLDLTHTIDGFKGNERCSASRLRRLFVATQAVRGDSG